MTEQNHFWAGSMCTVDKENGHTFPEGVLGVSDVITLNADLGNHIPDKSWMLYLFELFIDEKRNVPLELDLICQFDNQDYFEAIFGGHNQYRFKEVLPKVGNSYKREINMKPQEPSITYNLTDLTTGQHESFKLGQNNVQHPSVTMSNLSLQGAMHFTGIEWWNKVGTVPYPVKYQVEISFLQYARPEVTSPDKIGYVAYNSLIPDNDKLDKEYPISFTNPRTMDGCICYTVDSGNSKFGLTYNI